MEQEYSRKQEDALAEAAAAKARATYRIHNCASATILDAVAEGRDITQAMRQMAGAVSTGGPASAYAAMLDAVSEANAAGRKGLMT